MGSLIILVAFFVIAAIFWVIGKSLDWLSRYLRKKSEETAYLKDRIIRTMDNIECIREISAPLARRIDPIDNLIRANQEILEKEKLKKAAKEELGVDF